MTDRAQQRSSKGNTHYLESSNDTQASVKQSFACRLSASHTRRTHEVTSSYRGPSSCDVSAIFLLLPPATRAHSPSSLRPQSSTFIRQESECERRCLHTPREITYDSQCTCLFSSVLALYNRSLFHAANRAK